MRLAGPGLALIALGAILKFAVTAHAKGLNLGTIGVILMIVGAVGVVIGIAMMSTRRRTDVIAHPDGSATYVEPRRDIDVY